MSLAEATRLRARLASSLLVVLAACNEATPPTDTGNGAEHDTGGAAASDLAATDASTAARPHRDADASVLAAPDASADSADASASGTQVTDAAPGDEPHQANDAAMRDAQAATTDAAAASDAGGQADAGSTPDAAADAGIPPGPLERSAVIRDGFRTFTFRLEGTASADPILLRPLGQSACSGIGVGAISITTEPYDLSDARVVHRVIGCGFDSARVPLDYLGDWPERGVRKFLVREEHRRTQFFGTIHIEERDQGVSKFVEILHVHMDQVDPGQWRTRCDDGLRLSPRPIDDDPLTCSWSGVAVRVLDDSGRVAIRYLREDIEWVSQLERYHLPEEVDFP